MAVLGTDALIYEGGDFIEVGYDKAYPGYEPKPMLVILVFY